MEGLESEQWTILNRDNLLLINFGLCFYMTGVIWLIQLSHYPSFLDIDPARFLNFHDKHNQAMTLIVGPIMVLELATAGLLVLPMTLEGTQTWGEVLNWGLILNLLAVILLWGFTFLVSVPIHAKLGQGYDQVLIQSLVVTNWWRTALWSFRSVGLLAAVVKFN